MRTLIQNRDLKTLFGGVAIAAASGLLMGGVMYPDLDADKVEGPQILMGGGGARSDATIPESGLSSYAGRVPDYVIGTDALKPAQYQVVAYEERPEAEPAETGEASDVMAYEAPPVRWHDEPREPTSYPSQRGNVVYAADLPPPPEPPADGEDPGEDYPTGG
jgi:hypothetical protein